MRKVVSATVLGLLLTVGYQPAEREPEVEESWERAEPKQHAFHTLAHTEQHLFDALEAVEEEEKHE